MCVGLYVTDVWYTVYDTISHVRSSIHTRASFGRFLSLCFSLFSSPETARNIHIHKYVYHTTSVHYEHILILIHHALFFLLLFYELRRKGKSKSAVPYKRSPPSWLNINNDDVEELIAKLARKGLKPSQIGVVLRDWHGIAKVKGVTGSTILRLLKKMGLQPELPEDLYHLIKKAVSVRKHLERNRKDKDSKFRLILIESRIHRISRYYKRSKKLPANWKYESSTASALVA